PLKSGWYNQEIDQAPLISATGAAYHRLHTPERMPVAVRDAFLQARRERRPVVIGIPFDLQDRPWNGAADLPKPSHQLLPRPSPAYHAGGGGQLWPKAKLLQIDIDPVAVSQGQEVARHHLRADARLGIEALTAALPSRKGGWRNDAMAARIRDTKPDSMKFEI